MNIQISFGDRNFGTEALIGIVAAIMVIVGSVGPWASVITAFGTVNINGTTGDGVITLVISIAAFFWLIRYLTNDDSSTGSLVWIAILFGVIFGVGMYTYNNLSELITSESNNEFARMSTGWGLTFVLIASFVGFADVGYAAFKSWRQED